jgi:hypothetical protein
MDAGFKQAIGVAVPTPVSYSWTGRPDAPTIPPDWANTYKLGPAITKNLLSQIAYDKSQWDYSKIGTGNQLGRYQFTPEILESYGLLAANSNKQYGADCVNYQQCWRQRTIRKNTNSYSNYLYNVTSLKEFLNNTVAQEHLAHQVVHDVYNDLRKINAIQESDSQDIIAGMIYVGWELGTGETPSALNSNGTGAYAWRYSGIGSGATTFNSGRYAATVLNQ